MELEEKLKRLRKLWTLAKSRNNTRWMLQIEKSAANLKNLQENKSVGGIIEKTVGEMTTAEIEAVLGTWQRVYKGVV